MQPGSASQPQTSTAGPSTEAPVEKPIVRITETTPSREPGGRAGDEAGRTGERQVLELELRRGPVGSGKIALTFDAGASSKPTPALLKVLDEKGVRATFFLTGRWVEKNPELVREIAAAGHEIGNHTYSHPDLRKLPDDQVREQLEKMEKLVQTAAGVSTKPYFRPPFGACDARVRRIAAEEGYRCVIWTADSWDAFKEGIEAEEIEQRVLGKAQDGAIILMHCGSWPTVSALPGIIDQLSARGLELVRVSELVSEPSE